MPQDPQTSKLGRNRTGILSAPGDREQMLSAVESPLARPSSEGDESEIAELRASYVVESDLVGSVPPPPTLKGVAKAGAQMLTGKRPQVLLDRLSERLAFERTGTRMYEALIAKCRSDGQAVVDAQRLAQFRDEEARHFKLVNDCIETLGADPTVQTPCADVSGMEALGLVQVVTDPRASLGQSLHALLIAELADNAGWDGLIALARELGQDEMVQRFTEAQGHEREHLQTVTAWHQQLTLDEAKA